MAVTISDLAYTKNYSDDTRPTEAVLDAAFESIQTYLNDSVKDNLVQLAKDCHGNTDYTLDGDGSANYTNSLFAKQYATDYYNGGDISIGVAADGAYAAVDAVNASILFTPERVGQYRATCRFNHTFTTTATTEGTCEVSFRLTDGTDASYSVRSGGYLPATAAGSGKLSVPIGVSHVFDWTTTTAKTVSLQKYVRAATQVATNIVAATAATGEVYLTVEKI